MTEIRFVKGDITDLAVDAIVNAANTDLLLGAGVAGAIRRKGGPRIQEECAAHGPIPLGGAAATTGGNLAAKYVIHAAAMRLGEAATEDSIREATRNSLHCAEEKGVHSIALPALGTGVGGFPLKRCAEIMIGEVMEYTQAETKLDEVDFVLFDGAALAAFEGTLKAMKGARATGSR